MLIKLTVFLPLLAFLASSLLGRFAVGKNKIFADKFAQFFTSSLLVISAICAIIIFAQYYQSPEVVNITLFNWISSGTLVVNWSLYLDSLTATMLVVVTVVSALVHIYSIGYMAKDMSINRFMSYLSLFTFFMLILVTADNFLQLFVGWEGVGVASYLLIGFWFKKQSANAAAMKAFIVNRVGDFGLILALALIYLTFGSLEYSVVFSQAQNYLSNETSLFFGNYLTIDVICILLFIGAMGKSAQIGLHVWLADAMEGPTPVSALIHAATMVTAGVFLVVRCSPLFEYSEIALNMITLVGAFTAIFAATIAITQNDIKKVIAYSTCSQLGYMFFACGVSAYSAAIFHLATHAFFKALLFLGAGSVIYAMHHEQDMRKMGGIWKKIPITYAMMWIGSLALAGFPPFSGFFSKDVILEAAYMSSGKYSNLAFILGIIAAFLTAFYSWRLIFLVFHGESKADKQTLDHAHESPLSMQIPLYILAIGSVFAGYIGMNQLSFISSDASFFAESIFVSPAKSGLLEEIHHTPILIKYLPLIIGVIAILLAYIIYIKKQGLAAKIAQKLNIFYKISLNKWYFDEIYQLLLVNPVKSIGSFLWKVIDIKMVDAVPNGLASISRILSQKISKLETGYIYNYSLWMILGLVFTLLFIVVSIKDFAIF